MIHVQHGEVNRLDMARFNEAFMMHTSTSPQYGIIASCDVAAAMMEQPAGRALVQETIDEALAFRRAMTAVREQLSGSWWFEVWQPEVMAERPVADQARWILHPGDRWHGFEGLADNHVLVDPIKATLLTPGLSADGQMTEHGIPAAIVTKFLPARRIEIEKTGLYSYLVLFSMGITRGKWSTLVTELINFKDLYDANAPLLRVLPALVEAHPETYARTGLMTPAEDESKLNTLIAKLVKFKNLWDRDAPLAEVLPTVCDAHRERYQGYTLRRICNEMHNFYREANIKELQRLCFRASSFPRLAMSPKDAYEALVANAVDYVPLEDIKGRVSATLALIYPPGIGVVLPGERWDERAQPMLEYFLAFQESFNQFPGFNYEVQGVFQERLKGRIKFYSYVVRE